MKMMAIGLGKQKGAESIHHQSPAIMHELVEEYGRTILENAPVLGGIAIIENAYDDTYLIKGLSPEEIISEEPKLKEISYIHAEGYPAAEMKHGTIALIDDDMPTVVIAPRDKIYDKTVSNIQQIKARNGRIIALVTRGDEVAAKIADYVIEIPEVCECLSPILTSVPLQLLAYYVAVNKGRNVDQPRNLAKSVTVE